jgi:DNA repair photolyase
LPAIVSPIRERSAPATLDIGRIKSENERVLFDALSGPKLIGIARMAAQSELLEAKRRVEYLEIDARSLITKCTSPRMPFIWTVNPYRGCEFGCRYCYARYTHEFMELRDPELFETRIFAKAFNAAAFRADLARVPQQEAVWIGTATDPYQPAERRYRITRQMLEVLARTEGRRIGITTKSDLVTRDVDLLRDIARGNVLHVNMTITTLDEALARLLEPLAPRPALRLGAIETLAAAGVRCTVLMHPVMPLINDGEASMDAVCGAGANAGIVSFSAAALFLKPCSKQVFLPFVEKHFPQLTDHYRQLYARRAYLTGEYPERIRSVVRSLIAKYGLQERGVADLPEAWPAVRQMKLF